MPRRHRGLRRAYGQSTPTLVGCAVVLTVGALLVVFLLFVG